MDPFAKSMRGQPWARGAEVPWHLWGNRQQITASDPLGFGQVPPNIQLLSARYKRPDTWTWLVAARLVSHTNVGLTDTARVDVSFELILGIGRSTVTIPAFAPMSFVIIGPNLSVVDTAPVLWRTMTTAPHTWTYDGNGGGTPDVTLDSQDVESLPTENFILQASVVANRNGIPAPSPKPVVEVVAQCAPRTHVRPDWYQDAVPEVTFPGGEVGGR